jgi:hypothetical protein
VMINPIPPATTPIIDSLTCARYPSASGREVIE